MTPPEDGHSTSPNRGLFLAGDIVAGRYRIVRFIARGGMGEVYEAFDQTLGRSIALKTVRPDLVADAEAMDRFKRETLLASRVSHPNVCRVYDIGVHQIVIGTAPRPVTFLTMELLEGVTLEQHLRKEGRMPSAEAERLLRQIAGGLDAAHRAGVIHRDFKPANVILVPESGGEGPRAVITDFGLARSVDDAVSGLTRTGLVVGTPAYMAPEQAQGLELTSRSDLYSFGVVAYEMLTGRLPHSGATPMALLVEKTKTAAPSPVVHAPGLDPTLATTILTCLEIDPAKRFASAGEAVAALGGVSVPGSASFSRRSGTAEADRRRKRSLLWGSVSVAIALIAVLGILVVDSFRGRRGPVRGARPKGPVTSTQATTSAGLDLFPSFLPDGRTLLFSAERQKGYEIVVRELGKEAGERLLTSDGFQNVQPSPSPSGDLIAYHSAGKGGIWVVPLTGAPPRQVSEFGSAPRFSPDGTTIVFQSDPLDLASATSPNFSDGSTIWVVRRDGSGLSRITQPSGPPGGHGAPSWTPDGRNVVFLSSTASGSILWSVSLADGKLRKLFSTTFRIFDPVTTPDGAEVLYAAVSPSGSAGIFAVPIRPDGRPAVTAEQVANLGPTRIRHIAVSPDGTRIAYGALSMTSHINVLPVESPALEATGPATALTSGTLRNSRPVYSPDGRRIAFTRSLTGGNEDIWIANSDGSEARALTASEATDSDPSWFPSGDRLLFTSNAGGKIRLYSVPLNGGSEEPVERAPGETPRARLSPDGRRVAYNITDFKGGLSISLLDLESGTVSAVTAPADSAGYPQWSPDGKSLSVQIAQGQKKVNVGIVSLEGPAPHAVRPVTFENGLSWNGGFSPDGTKILFAGERQGVWNLYWVSTDGKQQKQLTRYTRHNTYVRYPSLSSDGRSVVFELAETVGNIWVLEPGK